MHYTNTIITNEEDLIPKNEALDSIYTFFGMIATLLASSMPFKEKGTFLIQFSRFFEENMKSGFINEVEKLKSNNESGNLNVYLACLSRMLSNLGFTNNRMSSGSKGYMIISKCPWKNERHSNDIFCYGVPVNYSNNIIMDGC